jgi:gliding motility-associated-like protein
LKKTVSIFLIIILFFKYSPSAGSDLSGHSTEFDIHSITAIPFADTSYAIATSSGSDSFCNGNNLILSVLSNQNLPAGIAYQWFNSTGNITNATSNSLTINTSETYGVIIKRSGHLLDTVLQGILITQLPAVKANFTFVNGSICAGTPVAFTDNSTGSGLNYSWNFGDTNSRVNDSAFVQNPTHSFIGLPGNGTQSFTVTLTVNGSGGCRNSFSLPITTSQMPDASIADFTSSTPFTNCGNSIYNLTIDNISTTKTINTKYVINWGDGTPNYSAATLPTTGTIHTYTSLGYFTITVSITGQNGCIANKNYIVYNGSNPQVPASNPGSSIGKCVPFVFSIPLLPTINPPGTIYIVSKNDGTPNDTLYSPLPAYYTHAFLTSSCGAKGGITPNTFFINIRAQNPCGFSDLTIQPITTSIKPIAAFTMNPSPGACVNSTVTFNNTSISGTTVDNFGVCNYTTRKNWTISPASGWTVVSGSLGDPVPTNNPATWGSNNLGVSFSATGIYTITMIVSNDCGTDTISKQICITAPPLPSFTIDNTSGCSPLTVNTINTSSVFNGCTLPAYVWSVAYSPSNCSVSTAWSFANGTNATSLQPSFNFTNPGTYKIILSITTDCGTFTYSKTVTVNAPPTANFSTIPNLCNPATFNPSGIATIINCGSSPLTYLWSFPGASIASSTLANPGGISYASAGTYAINLQVTNECGIIFVTKNVTVIPPPKITSSSSTAITTCSGTDGTITLSGLLPNTAYSVSYTKNGNVRLVLLTSDANGNITISGLSAGIYSNIFVSLTSCPSNAVGPITLSDPAPPAKPVITVNTPICSGNSINLTTTAISGATYFWTGPNSFTSTLQNPSIANASVSANGNYTLKISMNNCSSNASIAVVVKNTPAAPVVTNISYCLYAVATPLTATPLSGNTLIWYTDTTSASGSSVAPTPVTSTTGTTNYYVSQSSPTSCESQKALIKITVAPVPNITSVAFTGTTTCSGSDGTISLNGLSPNSLYPVSYTKNGVPKTVVIKSDVNGTIVITGLTAGIYSNIFTTVGNCPSNAFGPFDLKDPNPLPIPVLSTNIPTCSGNNINFYASTNVAGVSYSWTGPNGFTSSLQNPTIPNASVAASGNYMLTVSMNNCTSTASISVTINPTPPAPTSSNVSYCLYDIASALTAQGSPGNTLNWYTDTINGTAGTTAPIPVTSFAGSTNYYVDQISSAGCVSPKSVITVTITAIPNISSSSLTAITTCAGTNGSITLMGLMPNTMYNLNYIKNSTPISSFIRTDANGTIVITGLSAGIYSNVFVKLGNCQSNVAGPFTLTDPLSIPLPVLASNGPICSGNTLNLTATGLTAGINYTWTGPNGFASTLQNPSISNASFLAGGSYTLTAKLNNCISSETISVVVNPTPNTPAVSDKIYCLNDPASQLTLQASNGNIINWYTDSTAGFASNFGPTPSTSTIGTSIYYVSQSSAANCESPRVSLKVIVNGVPNVNAVTNQILCNGTRDSLSFTGSVNGTVFNWTNSNPAIGLPASGTGSIGFVPTNPGNTPISALIKVSPVINTCIGTPISFTLSVNPAFVLSSTLTPNSICSNSIFNYSAAGSMANIKYSWTRPAVAGISNPSANSIDSTGIISETLINTSDSPKLVVYHFTLFATNGCTYSQNVGVTVNPNAKAAYTFTNNKLCSPGIINQSNINALLYPNTNKDYLWYANNTLLGNGTVFPGYSFINSNDSVIIKLVTTNLYGCKNDSIAKSFYTATKPVPAFTQSVSKGCGPLTVSFTNTTTPLPRNQFNYKWKFGNGDSSLLQDPPSITFNARSDHRDTIYYVTLTIYTACDSATYKDSVSVLSTPLARLQADTSSGCTISASPFLFTGINNSTGNNTTYYWNFGDGTIDTLSSKATDTHLYNVPQTTVFTIQLKAVNTCGSNTDSIKITVFPKYIVARLSLVGPNSWSCAPDSVSFTNTSSGANKYIINFGDRSADSIYISTIGNEIIKHFYRNPGTYIVSMHAINGCTNADTSINLLINLFQKPTADFKTAKAIYCKNESVSFQNLSLPGLIYQWYFGDGTTSAVYNPTHTYTQANTYQVSLVVKSISSPGVYCTDSIVHTITIADLPANTITSNLLPGNCAPFNFTGSVPLPAGSIANWHFQDPFSTDTLRMGNTGIHIFYQPGNYQVLLTMSNAQGCRDTSVSLIKVIPVPKASFTASDTIKCFSADSISFTNTSSYTLNDAVTYTWYVNGALQSVSNNFKYKFLASSAFRTPVYYKVMLVATNSFGCSDTAFKNITLLPGAIADFSISSPKGCAPVSVVLSNASLYSSDYRWYLNGQLFSTLASPDPLLLSQAGATYTIQLIAVQSLGCGLDSITKTIKTNARPVASFTSFDSILPCSSMLTVKFTDMSTSASGTINNWFWNFGDGQVSTVSDPVHQFTTPGNFRVSHYVTDDNGCISDTVYKPFKNYGKPSIGFVMNNACLGTPTAAIISFYDVGFGSTKIKSYLWDFGDGSIDTVLSPIHTYLKEGTYTVTLTILSDSSCTSETVKQTVTIYGKPIADFKFNSSCLNLPVHFFDKSFPGNSQTGIGSYRWNFGDGSALSSTRNPIHVFANLQQYKITLTVQSALCPTLGDSISKELNIVMPRASITYPRINAAREVPIQLSAYPGGICYLWEPPTELNNVNIQDPIAIYHKLDPSKLFYTISVTDSSGCIVQDYQEVWLFDHPDIFVPTAFTPNGDGANDLFIPVYVNISHLKYFRIFDRWGKLIFETMDMGKGWDGTINGKRMPMDTYVFMVIGVDNNGNSIFRKGDVTLIRD